MAAAAVAVNHKNRRSDLNDPIARLVESMPTGDEVLLEGTMGRQVVSAVGNTWMVLLGLPVKSLQNSVPRHGRDEQHGWSLLSKRGGGHAGRWPLAQVKFRLRLRGPHHGGPRF